jgi:hypothetical protein
LHNEAQKREKKQRASQIKFSPGSFVKVRTYIEVSNTEIQPIQLRLIEKSRFSTIFPIKNPLFRTKIADPALALKHQKVFIEDIPFYPKTAFSKAIIKSTFDWIMPNDISYIFRISEITITQTSNKSYQLTTIDGQYILEFMTHKKDNKWSAEFREYMLHHTTYDINTQSKHRPNYKFVSTPLANSEISKQTIQQLKVNHAQTLSNTKTKHKLEALKKETLLLNHFDGRNVFGLNEDEKLAILQKSPNSLENTLIYCNFTDNNNIESLAVVKLTKVHKVKGTHTKFTITRAKYMVMDPYAREYTTTDQTVKTFVLDFSKFLVSIDEDLQPDAKDEWMFVYPNQIRNSLKLDLVYVS